MDFQHIIENKVQNYMSTCRVNPHEKRQSCELAMFGINLNNIFSMLASNENHRLTYIDHFSSDLCVFLRLGFVLFGRFERSILGHSS